MRCKKIIALLLCFCIFSTAVPLEVFASDSTVNADDEYENTNSLGQLGGYLSGNAMTTSNLFAERKFSWETGFGFAAERGNNLIDRLTGTNTSVVGDNNIANGPDRMIINRDGSITWIQDKYYSNATNTVNSAFDDTTGLYKYLDGNGIQWSWKCLQINTMPPLNICGQRLKTA